MIGFILAIVCLIGVVALNIRQRSVREYYERKRDERCGAWRNPTKLTKDTIRPKAKK